MPVFRPVNEVLRQRARNYGVALTAGRAVQGVFEDVAQRGRFVETFPVESWNICGSTTA